MKRIAKVCAVLLSLLMIISSSIITGGGYDMTFTYTEKDDTLSFTYTGSSEVQTFNYKIEDSVLSIIDPEGGTITYTKK